MAPYFPPAPADYQLHYRPSALANLLAAERAVKFASDKLWGRSHNRAEDLVHALQQNLRADYGYSRSADEEINDRMSNKRYVHEKTQAIFQERWFAIDAARKKREAMGQGLSAPAILNDNIGNCFEHAVLASHYLKLGGIASYIATTDDDTNHVFVLIGSPGGLDGQTVNVTRIAPGAIAHAFAVVCDPWYHEWFSVQQDWGRKMWQIFALTTKQPTIRNPVPLKLTSQKHILP